MNDRFQLCRILFISLKWRIRISVMNPEDNPTSFSLVPLRRRAIMVESQSITLWKLFHDSYLSAAPSSWCSHARRLFASVPYQILVARMSPRVTQRESRRLVWIVAIPCQWKWESARARITWYMSKTGQCPITLPQVVRGLNNGLQATHGCYAFTSSVCNMLNCHWHFCLYNAISSRYFKLALSLLHFLKIHKLTSSALQDAHHFMIHNSSFNEIHGNYVCTRSMSEICANRIVECT